MRFIISIMIGVMLLSCTHKPDDIGQRVQYPCELNSPNPTYADVRTIINDKCNGCHNNQSIGNYHQYDVLNESCVNGSFFQRVFIKRTMPPSHTLDTCDYLILKRWFRNGHLPF